MIIRTIFTFIVLFLSTFINGFMNNITMLGTGIAAGDQFSNSNFEYLKTMTIFSGFNALSSITFTVVLLIIVAIWYSPVKKFISTLALVALIGLGITIKPNNALAFFETVDKTEAYFIGANESAFFVPNVGANKDSQVQFDSESYLNSNKIASKMFIVPHAKLSGSGGVSWLSGADYYVPTGKLYIVSREPYTNEWVKSTQRGTSVKDQGMYCQTKEGINVTAGLSIGVSVTEENAAKFFYIFGVKNNTIQNRNDPQSIFNAVYYGKSLSEVMDNVVINKVKTLVCNEIGIRSLDDANKDMIPMMSAIQKNTKEYLIASGITLSFIGWADTFEFDPSIQKSINDRYTALALKDQLATLQALADIKIQEGLSAGFASKGVPIVFNTDMITNLMNLVKPIIVPEIKKAQ